MTKNSYWLYIHPELSQKDHYWKVGRSLTPYSAVRSRQRYLIDDFYLTAVWFGKPDDIARLETTVQSIYKPLDSPGTGRRELIYYNPNEQHHSLETAIDVIIYGHKLKVVRRYTGNPRGYHATNSGQCPLHCDQEQYAHEWSRQQLKQQFTAIR